MHSVRNGFFGYQGRWAFVDLTERTVRIEPADKDICRDYIGGRGVQARLLCEHLASRGRVTDPLAPGNRIAIGTGPLNDTPVATAGRGSCSFISPMTRSPRPAPWIPQHTPIDGLLTHSSAGGVFPNMLKRAGIDQMVIDGRADRPVRLLVTEHGVDIVDAEDDLFDTTGGARCVRGASAITDFLTSKHPGSATLSVGPAGWNRVAFACLTGDHHRNFGRGGAGAVFGSKNLVAITAYGRHPARPFDPATFERLGRDVDDLVRSRAFDPQRTTSFRRTTGTTWWLDRAFDGGYMGTTGGYLPWHNFDEGYFDPGEYAGVGTTAFLEIAGRHRVCKRCRHVMCSRAARIDSGPFAGEGIRPEFETIALWINCCVLDRAAIFHLNQRCNDLGVDTMSAASVIAGAMEMADKGLLEGVDDVPLFGSARGAIDTLHAIAHQSNDIGRLLGGSSDDLIGQVAACRSASDAEAIAACVTTAFAGLGYAGIEPKVFPGMFAAYATSSRGRGDHTGAWTIQAEEGGLGEARQLAAYVAESQVGKALVDSLGLCDFFAGDITSDLFLAMYCALTGHDYSTEGILRCGERIHALERHLNNLQGRSRAYDAYIHPKLAVPLTAGPHAGKAVDAAGHEAILDAYYAYKHWPADGIVPPTRLAELGAPICAKA
jgi:aldehyde:ferredoxin oxidoreductase